MTKLTLIRGDITSLDVDAIVNAANSSLLGGGGVDGAIHRAGGSQILEECKAIRARQGGCKTGEAVITSGGKLKARFVIHTVGPVWQGGTSREEELLANAYRNSLTLAVENKIKRIAFPNISTGIYGFPKDRAATIAVQTVRSFRNESLEEITFCCFDEENYLLYKDILG
jgi:O-acetyl-ADP-ribose deacetylase (regulator of RNase III)